MSLSALNFLLLSLDSRRYRYIVWGGFGLSVILLLFSTSNCLSHFLDTLLLIPLFLELSMELQFGCALVYNCIISGRKCGYMACGYTEPQNALGRDVTLTGQNKLFVVVLDKISKHLLVRLWI